MPVSLLFFRQADPQNHGTRKKTVCYLKACGVTPSIAEVCYKMADLVRKNKQADAVAYDDPKGIGELLFPASWFGNDLSLKDYIEAIMHMLFLGVQESNYEMIQNWLKSPHKLEVCLVPAS